MSWATFGAYVVLVLADPSWLAIAGLACSWFLVALAQRSRRLLTAALWEQVDQLKEVMMSEKTYRVTVGGGGGGGDGVPLRSGKRTPLRERLRAARRAFKRGW